MIFYLFRLNSYWCQSKLILIVCLLETRIDNMIYVRCTSCNKVLANKYDRYCDLLRKGVSEKVALDTLKLMRYCCRSIMISNVDMSEQLNVYALKTTVKRTPTWYSTD